MRQESEADGKLGDTRWKVVLLACVGLMAVVIVGWALRAITVVVVPVLFATFLALLVAPLDKWGKRIAPSGMKWLGHLAAMSAILAVLVAFIGSIWIAARRVVDRFPSGEGADGGGILSSMGFERSDDAAALVDPGESSGSAGMGLPFLDDADGDGRPGTIAELAGLAGSAGESLSTQVGEWASAHAMTVLNMAGTTIGAAVIVFFTTLMMLVEAPRLQAKIGSMAGPHSRDTVMEAVGTIAHLLRRYLWARTIMGVLTAALYAGWLWIFDVDLLIVWALLAFLLNYIPTIGSLIAGVAAVLFVFVQKDFGTTLAVGAGLFVIEQVMGNYIDPRVQGRQVSVSPLVVLLALLFWAWIWGVAGAVLAVPVTIAFIIVGSHVRTLRPAALLLSGETDYEGLDRLAKH